MKRKGFSVFLAMAILATVTVFSSCEKMVTDEESVEDRDMSTVTLRASLYNIVAFGTRAVQDIKEYCSHITFAVYDADGKVVKTVEQSQGDSGYGEVTLTLAPATYKLLVLAHSSYGGTPSVTTPANIAFTNSIGYSDTFYYYNDLEVTGKNQALTLELQRAVTMLRFTINDELPSDLTKIRCQWSGASGTLNATTGWGGNATDQVAIYAVDGLTAPLTLRLYTFMRQETGTLNLTVNAYDSSNNVIAERTFTDVPVKNHMVTDFSGNFFSKGESDYSISLKAETEWGVYQDLTF